MSTYFKVFFEHDVRLGVAYDRVKPPTEIFSLPYKGPVADWKERRLELEVKTFSPEARAANIKEPQFADYMASNLGCRLCSAKLKAILDEHAGHDEIIQWLEVSIRNDKEYRPYFILHFPTPPDVLDEKDTIFVEGTDVVVKPVLARAKIGDHKVFSYPNGDQLSLFVTDQVKRAIQAAGCTGASFMKAAIR